MNPVIVVDPPRADSALVAGLGELGVATVLEAAGKSGPGLDRYGLRPVLDRLGVRCVPAQPREWPE
jgi:hypothetical protein